MRNAGMPICSGVMPASRHVLGNHANSLPRGMPDPTPGRSRARAGVPGPYDQLCAQLSRVIAADQVELLELA
jgi:hypothetical protein